MMTKPIKVVKRTQKGEKGEKEEEATQSKADIPTQTNAATSLLVSMSAKPNRTHL